MHTQQSFPAIPNASHGDVASNMYNVNSSP